MRRGEGPLPGNAPVRARCRRVPSAPGRCAMRRSLPPRAAAQRARGSRMPEWRSRRAEYHAALGMMRAIERELLDELPADDLRAIHSRRDLQRVNAWMGHAGIMADTLAGTFQDRSPQIDRRA